MKRDQRISTIQDETEMMDRLEESRSISRRLSLRKSFTTLTNLSRQVKRLSESHTSSSLPAISRVGNESNDRLQSITGRFSTTKRRSSVFLPSNMYYNNRSSIPMSSPTRIREEEKSDGHHIALNLLLFLLWAVVLFVIYDSLRTSPAKPTFGLPFCNSEIFGGLAVVEEASTLGTCQPCPNHGYCMEGELVACNNEEEDLNDQYIKYKSICIPKKEQADQIEAAKLAFVTQTILYEQHKRSPIQSNGTHIETNALQRILVDSYTKEMTYLLKPVAKGLAFSNIFQKMVTIIKDQSSLGIQIHNKPANDTVVLQSFSLRMMQ